MRTSTLILTDLVLRHGGLRAAARATGAPLSSVSAGVARFEAGLSLTLIRRSAAGAAPSVAAHRLAPGITRMADLAREIHGIGADALPGHPISLAALFRLAEAARLGSIRRAAAVMGIGQPRLTRQLAQIEANHGTALLTRTAKGITPTPEGNRVLGLTERLEAEWRAFSGEAEPLHSLASRRFSLGTIIPATERGDAARIVAGVVSRLYLDHAMTISVASAIAEDLMAGLDNGRFDAVLIDTDLSDPDYRQQELARSPVALIGHQIPMDPGDRAQLAQALMRRPFVLQSRRSGLRQRAEAFLDASAGADWRRRIPLIEVDSLPVIVSMVTGGKFNSILPGHVGTSLPAGLAHPLPAGFDQRLQLTWRRTPRTERFARTVIACATEG
ncbi:MAG: LysR family transcriptional regulator [Paracoccus sp. (in: a-proteobacteria)]|nr:LysR family transcriptional regulator [Paracoccus sp. (in: a-proteobacteria)]